MRKIFFMLLIIGFAFITVNSFAADGDMIVNGKVGIGTTTPTTKLEVNGQIKITGGTPGAGKVLTSDANGLATWQTPAEGLVYKRAANNYCGGTAFLCFVAQDMYLLVPTGKILGLSDFGWFTEGDYGPVTPHWGSSGTGFCAYVLCTQ